MLNLGGNKKSRQGAGSKSFSINELAFFKELKMLPLWAVVPFGRMGGQKLHKQFNAIVEVFC